MRTLSLLLVLLSVTAVLAQNAPPHPLPAGRNDGNMGMCQLDGIQLTNGLTLKGTFAKNTFSYECTAADWTKVSGAQLKVDLHDDASTASVWFRGKAVNTKTLGNGLTGSGTQTSNALTAGDNAFKAGDNWIQIAVSCAVNEAGEHVCNYVYEINCFWPTSGGYVTGDPQFVGLRGQNYQVHGVSGEVYNIVSDADLQYNSRFVFLTSGRCPIVDGRRQKACWSHPGTYLGELGLKTRAGDRIRVVAGSADNGFKALTVNDRQMEIGDTVFLAGDLGAVSFNSTHLATIAIGNWDFAFENSDMFINQRVRVLDARGLRSHGLLGQTWRDATYNNAVKYIQGQVDDYAIRDNDIFGDNFVYNNFN